MFRDWSDGKRFIAEDLAVYVALLLLAVSWDYVVNLLIASRFISSPFHGYSHPIGFGRGQLMLLVLAIIQLIRKIDAWKYYR